MPVLAQGHPARRGRGGMMCPCKIKPLLETAPRVPAAPSDALADRGRLCKHTRHKRPVVLSWPVFRISQLIHTGSTDESGVATPTLLQPLSLRSAHMGLRVCAASRDSHSPCALDARALFLVAGRARAPPIAALCPRNRNLGRVACKPNSFRANSSHWTDACTCSRTP